MAFPSNGINHHNAISSEKNISKYVRQLEIFYDKKIKDIIQLGGAKNKTDYIILFEDGTESNHSLKSKKNIKSGSFDYVNTTIGPLSEYMVQTLDIYKTYRGCQKSSKYELLRQSISDEIRMNINSDVLTKFFLDNVIKKYKENNLSLTIEDQKTNTLHINVIPKIFEFVSNGGKLIIRCRGTKKSMSYTVDGVTDDGEIINDFGLRFRIHLNNGSTKWLKGDNSTIVVKFQQDKVHNLIKNKTNDV